uniref:Uncharacterized protein n=1 Tax=Gokushovirinae environmental samples TaxID=1478972 RepID=A0A2R3UAD6_9VIRU|nr:hypothetical protein [Gokushovirinae environmental samples]
MEAINTLLRGLEMRLERQRKVLAQTEKELEALRAIDKAQSQLPLAPSKAR